MKKLLLTLILLLVGSGASATHMSGGEIYWECIGPNQFRIKLVVYRDCAGINVDPSYNLQLTSPCGNRTLAVTTPGGVEISQLCDIQLPNSTCSGGTLPGIQQYVYTGTITLPPCNSWSITWTNIYRNNAIVNLTNPGTREMYIEGVLNSAAAPCNDSPTFTNTAIPYVCLGFPVSYSYGAIDPEADSLSYALIGARMANAAPIPYTPGNSAAAPIPGITLNPATGQINFTLNVAGNWVVVVRVTQYDANGNVIGTIMRDMQFVAYPCSNIPPDASSGLVSNLTGTAIQTGPRSVTVCESGNFCYNMVITDANAGNILTATTNLQQNLPGATITYSGTNPLTAHVCWNAQPNTAGFYAYIVTVNDGACPIPAIQTYVYSVRVLAGLAATITTTDESCTGTADGTASTSIVTGTSPYTYLWSNGATTPNITAGPGTYTVTISDGNNCISPTLSGTIGSNGIPNSANAGPDLVGCANALPVQLSGSVVNATGGAWSGGAGTMSGPWSTPLYQPTQQEISAGSVQLTLTTTGNTTCPPASDVVMISLPNSFASQSISGTNALCNGGSGGTASFLPNNATFSYLWNDPQQQTTANATGLTVGDYTITVADTYGCSTQMSITLSQPAALAIANISSTAVSCTGAGNGSATVTPSGGTPPYTYLWSTGATTATTVASVGTHTVSVSDANNCAAVTAQVDVTANGSPNSANAGPDLVGCANALPVQLSGSVVNATGGTWSGGAGMMSGPWSTPQYQPTQQEIAAGSVQLTLTTTGNTTCPPASDVVVISLPNSFASQAIAATNVLCNGGNSGTATFSPNNAAFSYLWNDPQQQTTATATGLTIGAYTVSVVDPFGCNTQLSVTLSQPAALAIANISSTAVTCTGAGDGSATVTPSGGTPPYTYLWSTGATTATTAAGVGMHSVSVSDANNCAAVTAQVNVTATGSPNSANAGPDLIGCMGAPPLQLNGTVTNATGGFWSGGTGTISGSGTTVTYVPSSNEVNAGGVDLYLTTTGNTSCPTDVDTIHIALSNSYINTILTPTAALCNGASNGTITVSPALPGLTYQWNDAAQQTTAIATGLGVGTYTVLLTDQLGCDSSFSATITEPTVLTIPQINSVNVTCSGGNNGSATVVISGGTPPYSMQWSNGGTANTAAGLMTGNYGVTVSDGNGCAAQSSISISEPPPIILTAQAPDTVCINTLVQLTAQASGGTGFLSYNWNGLGYNDTINAAFSASQTISVSVTDQAGCSGPTVTLPIYVLDISTATLTTYGDTTVCSGGSGSIGAALLNYPGSYVMSWTELGTNGPGPLTVPITENGIQHVVVTGQCGNTLSGSVILRIQSPPSVSLPAIIAEACAPYTTHFPNLQLGNVTVLWDLGNGNTSSQASPVVNYPPGTYQVSLTVTTPLGCTATSPSYGQVIIHAPPTAAFTASTWEVDFDNALIEFTDHSVGTITNYAWTFGDGGSSGQASPAYTYTEPGYFQVELFVEDQYGCTSTADHPIHITPIYDIVIPTAFTPNPNGNSGGQWVTGDLSNDVFYPFVRFVDEFKMRVFNRWGELIFESNDLKIGWDGFYRGEMCPQDMYVVQTWYKFLDGKEIKKLSDLTLIR